MNEIRRSAPGLDHVCLDGRSPAPRRDAGAASRSAAATPLLRVRLLGGFLVERADSGQVGLDWPRRSAKVLIKLLAAYPGHAMHREQIVSVLWPDVDTESALNSFGKALHAARRVLEPSLPRRQDSAYLRMADSMVVLNTEHVVIDTDVFERLAADAVRCGEAEAYQAALLAYGGELLPEDRYESWCAERRNTLAETRIRLLLGLAEAHERSGACSEAADLLREVLSQDPTREAVHRQLMRLYARMGMPDQAVRQFHVCEQVLHRELDLAPQPETALLYDAIHASRFPRRPPEHAAGQSESPGRPRAPIAGSHVFVGRERVLQGMCELLTPRDEPRLGMLVVTGESGVGKTRLLEEFAVRAGDQGAIVLRGGRGAHANQFACGPFAVALEDYAARLPQVGRAELARRYPALARFVPSLRGGVPLPASAPDAGSYVLDIIPSIVQFLEDLTRGKPVLLVFGDLHEIDEVGLDLIVYLVHLAARIPLLMAGTLRDPDTGVGARLRRMAEAMTRERLWRSVELRCLSRRASDQLVRALLPDDYVGDGVLTEIYAASRGNPLFVRELAVGMSSSGDMAAAGEGSRDPARLAARLPARMHALTALQLSLMDDSLRRMLGLTAVAGATEISLSQLRSAAAALEPPLAVSALFDALDRALRTHILEERPAGYAFRHPVVRAAVYDWFPRHRRDEFREAMSVGGAAIHS